MENAAYLALATNRTLVLPPVFPHHSFKESDEHKLLFPAFPYKTGGVNCAPYERYHEFIQSIQNDVKKAGDPNVTFPSFMQLFNFSDIFNKTGLNVIDMAEFARHSQNTNITSWCSGLKDGIENKMVPLCDKSEQLNFTDFLHDFQHICGLDQRVAVIGSAYVMPKPLWTSRGQVAYYFNKLIAPNNNFLSLLNQIYSRITEGYAGVAIRFRDDFDIDRCDYPDLKKVYDNVLHDLVKQKFKATTSTNDTRPAVLIGNGHKAAMKCFRHHARGMYNPLTVSGIINSDVHLQYMVDRIESEKSTIYLLLDQILIGLADKLVLQKVATTADTFHSRIRLWHDRRNMVIEKMHSAPNFQLANVDS